MRRLIMKFIVLIMFLGITICFAAAGNAAGNGAPGIPVGMEARVNTYSGDIIDNTCVQLNQNNLSKIAPTYSKEDALQPGCAKSGYQLYTGDGKLFEFNKRSNKKVEEFLKKPDSTIRVTVTAELIKNKLSLITIKNQK